MLFTDFELSENKTNNNYCLLFIVCLFSATIYIILVQLWKKMTQKEYLNQIEEQLLLYEDLQNPVVQAWNNACKMTEIDESSPIYLLGEHLASLPWFNEVKNPYHNGVHTAQVIHSGVFLLNLEKENDSFKDVNWLKITPYFIIALMFHDYKHLGRKNKFPFEMEQIAVDELSIYLSLNENFYNFWSERLEFDIEQKISEIIELVKSLILATEVSESTPYHREEYLKKGKDVDILSSLHLLMSEADLLPSVLPVLGKRNAVGLAAELELPMIAQNTGRIGFLKSVKYVSFASEKIEIQKMIDNEILELLK